MIRRPLWYILAVPLCLAIAACGSTTAGKSSSTVSVSIGAADGTVEFGAPAVRRAPSTVATLLFTITASDMETISQIADYTPPQTSVIMDIPNGQSRQFTVEAKNANGVTIYAGGVIVDLNGAPATLTVVLDPLVFTGTRLHGTVLDDFGYALARDGKGNIVMAGLTYGDFNNPANTSPANGNGNAFIAKFDQFGLPLWTRQFGTASGTLANAVAADGNGNIFVVGGTGGNLNNETNHGFLDAFVVKFDSSGNTLWTRLIGGTGDDLGNGVAVDPSGNVYVTGFVGSIASATAAAGVNTGNDVFVAKFDAAGTQQWYVPYGTTGTDSGQAVAVDASGNVFVAGTTDGALDGNLNAGSTDFFISKFDLQGSNRITRQLGTTDVDQAAAMTIDTNGIIYIAGQTYGNLDGQTNADQTGLTSDIFVVKYDAATLTKQSTWLAGTNKNDVAHGAAVDTAGDVFVSGSTNGAFSGSTNAGGYDSLVLKFRPSGSLAWARQLGTTKDDEGRGLVMDGNGNAVVTGDANGLFAGLQSVKYDAFLMTYSTDGVEQ